MILRPLAALFLALAAPAAQALPNGLSNQSVARVGVTSGAPVAPTPVDWLFDFSSTIAGVPLTTLTIAAAQEAASIGTVTYDNTAGPLTAFTAEDASFTSSAVFAVSGGSSISSFTKELLIDDSGRSGAMGYMGWAQAVPGAPTQYSVGGISEFNGESGGGGEDLAIDHIDVQGSTAIMQQRKDATDVTPGSAGILWAHGTAGFGAGIPIVTGTKYMWSLLNDEANGRVSLIVQDAVTRAYLGSSTDTSAVTAVGSQTFHDYNTIYGGTTHHTTLYGSYAGLFPIDAEFVLPEVTSLAVTQILPNSLTVTWADVGPVANGTLTANDTLDRYIVERDIDGGGFVELADDVFNRWYIDSTGIANGNVVTYRVKHYLLDTAHESAFATAAPKTVDNSTTIPYTTNRIAHYIGRGVLGFTNNQRLPSIPDYSGNNFSLTQAGSAQQFLFKTSGINSLPGFQSDGTDDVMAATLSDGGSVTIGAARTIFMVIRKVTAAAAVTDAAAGFGTSNSIMPYTNTGSGAGYLYYEAGGERLIGGTPTVANVLTFRFNSVSSLDIRLNGAAVQTGVNPNDGYNTTALKLGVDASSSDYGDYLYAEIAVFNEAVNNTNAGAIEAYLKTTYNTP